jgi:hypothetical protein
VESKTERIVLETDRHRIVGHVTLPREGYRSRLSDYLNRGELAFIALTDASIAPLDGGPGEDRRFVAVARAHVRIVHPEADRDEPGDG